MCWECDVAVNGINVELYKNREFDIVTGACIGDESTKITSIVSNKEINNMLSDFDYKEYAARTHVHSYKKKDYVKIGELKEAPPMILSCKEIKLKDGTKFHVDNIQIDISNDCEVYKLYSNGTYLDKTYYNQTKEMVSEWVRADLKKIEKIMTNIANELYDQSILEYKNSSRLYRFFNTPDTPHLQLTYSTLDLYRMTPLITFTDDIRNRIEKNVANLKYVKNWWEPMGKKKYYLALDYREKINQFIKEQEAKKCEETK